MKKRNYVTLIVIAVFFLGLSLCNLVIQTPDYSDSERRVLARFPKVSIESIFNGEFSKEFDEYAVERFVGRDSWRSIKAYTQTKVLFQKDNNDIYTADGHLSKIEYPMNTDMLDYAVTIFSKIQEQYLAGNQVYLAIIPDKNKYLAEESGHLEMDYEFLAEYIKNQMDDVKYIEISDLLEADDYYQTDTHWRQERIVDVAERLADEMGTTINTDYEMRTLEEPFYGVYVGQSALKCDPDVIRYLISESLEHVTVDGADAVYDMKKAANKDPYEMFLSGNQPVITMKNAKATNEKRLVLFRDSFGSSLAPLLISGYSEIVLVDLRYISAGMLGDYVDFEDADILFLYSTMLLNQSKSLRF